MFSSPVRPHPSPSSARTSFNGAPSGPLTPTHLGSTASRQYYHTSGTSTLLFPPHNPTLFVHDQMRTGLMARQKSSEGLEATRHASLDGVSAEGEAQTRGPDVDAFGERRDSSSRERFPPSFMDLERIDELLWEAQSALITHNYVLAVSSLMLATSLGSSSAALNLAQMYFRGSKRGTRLLVEQDATRAGEYFLTGLAIEEGKRAGVILEGTTIEEEDDVNSNEGEGAGVSSKLSVAPAPLALAQTDFPNPQRTLELVAGLTSLYRYGRIRYGDPPSILPRVLDRPAESLLFGDATTSRWAEGGGRNSPLPSASSPSRKGSNVWRLGARFATSILASSPLAAEAEGVEEKCASSSGGERDEGKLTRIRTLVHLYYLLAAVHWRDSSAAPYRSSPLSSGDPTGRGPFSFDNASAHGQQAERYWRLCAELGETGHEGADELVQRARERVVKLEADKRWDGQVGPSADALDGTSGAGSERIHAWASSPTSVGSDLAFPQLRRSSAVGVGDDGSSAARSGTPSSSSSRAHSKAGTTAPTSVESSSPEMEREEDEQVKRWKEEFALWPKPSSRVSAPKLQSGSRGAGGERRSDGRKQGRGKQAEIAHAESRRPSLPRPAGSLSSSSTDDGRAEGVPFPSSDAAGPSNHSDPSKTHLSTPSSTVDLSAATRARTLSQASHFSSAARSITSIVSCSPSLLIPARPRPLAVAHDSTKAEYSMGEVRTVGVFAEIPSVHGSAEASSSSDGPAGRGKTVRHRPSASDSLRRHAQAQASLRAAGGARVGSERAREYLMQVAAGEGQGGSRRRAKSLFGTFEQPARSRGAASNGQRRGASQGIVEAEAGAIAEGEEPSGVALVHGVTEDVLLAPGLTRALSRSRSKLGPEVPLPTLPAHRSSHKLDKANAVGTGDGALAGDAHARSRRTSILDSISKVWKTNQPAQIAARPSVREAFESVNSTEAASPVASTSQAAVVNDDGVPPLPPQPPTRPTPETRTARTPASTTSLDPALAAAEASSRLAVVSRCAVCDRTVVNAPRTRDGLAFCSRECRVARKEVVEKAKAQEEDPKAEAEGPVWGASSDAGAVDADAGVIVGDGTDGAVSRDGTT